MQYQKKKFKMLKMLSSNWVLRFFIYWHTQTSKCSIEGLIDYVFSDSSGHMNLHLFDLKAIQCSV